MNVPAPNDTADAQARARQRRRRWQMAMFVGVALAGVLIVLYAWRLPPFRSAIQSTENAFVRGQVTIIAPQLSGYITQVKVQDFQQVKRGDLLVQIDDRIYRQRLEQAQAQLQSQQAALANAVQDRRSAQAQVAQSEASIRNAQAQAQVTAADLARIEPLATQQLLSQADRDQARAARAQAQAAVAQAQAGREIARQNVQSVEVNQGALEAAVANAQAAIRLAQIDLDNTTIRAPRDGQLGQVAVRVGAFVNPGTQLMALVPERLWVIANMKETQMANVRIGQPASFTVDALGRARLQGRVAEISPATGSEFSVLPADNATGNFVKIAQRIPVKVSIDDGQAPAARLRPGMSVVVRIDTSVEGTAR
ncbi:HlyD family secretion protein [Lysobacter sp. LF1]|uniref:HlyD family secretion protein n=1 Tax=Lysobacter stagni TaxID=3045172 RepID=A0ABT6XEE5_9GAMM|nr:HlyD family secretion protein [Lysobacter sp. LF1]MDI9238508.1 HlyD family secretion protein [Lysobacter sp. LF1]